MLLVLRQPSPAYTDLQFYPRAEAMLHVKTFASDKSVCPCSLRLETEHPWNFSSYVTYAHLGVDYARGSSYLLLYGGLCCCAGILLPSLFPVL